MKEGIITLQMNECVSVHKNCFKCDICSDLIEIGNDGRGSFTFNSGKPTHIQCFKQQNPNAHLLDSKQINLGKCGRCHNKIDGKKVYTRIGNVNYHPECLTCQGISIYIYIHIYIFIIYLCFPISGDNCKFLFKSPNYEHYPVEIDGENKMLCKDCSDKLINSDDSDDIYDDE